MSGKGHHHKKQRVTDLRNYCKRSATLARIDGIRAVARADAYHEASTRIGENVQDAVDWLEKQVTSMSRDLEELEGEHEDGSTVYVVKRAKVEALSALLELTRAE